MIAFVFCGEQDSFELAAALVSYSVLLSHTLLHAFSDILGCVHPDTLIAVRFTNYPAAYCMYRRAHSPTIFAYISAMSAIKMAGRWEEGLGLLDEMDEAGLISDVFR